jgi:cell wall-associated NlpC family hydrolase
LLTRINTMLRSRAVKIVSCVAACALAGTAFAQEADLPSPMPQRIVQAVHTQASELVVSALAFLDAPYRRGGDGNGGFDCSGFTRHVFERTLGLVLPRRADEQAHAPQLVKVERADLMPGDLVFFDTLARPFSHVGIYLGDGRFIHAPRVGSAVRIEQIDAAYWTRRFTGARRLAPPRP